MFSGCSSSSYSDRYNKPKEKESKEKKGSVRFSSDDNAEKTEDTRKANDYYILRNIEKEFDVDPVEEYKIDPQKFVKKYNKLKEFNLALTPREKVLFEVITYLDTPYKYGGNSKEGIDCSAFTQNVFSNSLNLVLPRTAKQQFQKGQSISSKTNLKFGDLVFFNTTSRSYPGHVGIYLGENLFVHASRSKGVVISSLQSTYYKERYIGGKRVNNSF